MSSMPPVTDSRAFLSTLGSGRRLLSRNESAYLLMATTMVLRLAGRPVSLSTSSRICAARAL